MKITVKSPVGYDEGGFYLYAGLCLFVSSVRDYLLITAKAITSGTLSTYIATLIPFYEFIITFSGEAGSGVSPRGINSTSGYPEGTISFCYHFFLPSFVFPYLRPSYVNQIL
jgi:hypothetical protein